MKKLKLLKWALPVLLLSTLTFELLPGSAQYYAKEENGDLLSIAYNFFNIEQQSTAASCLSLAGAVTFATMILTFGAACIKKFKPYRWICWCLLTAGTLTTIPYITQSEDVFVQPNVIVIFLLVGCWVISFYLDKHKAEEQEEQQQGRRL